MILDIRGTHGSGKSHIPIKLLRDFYNEKITGLCYPGTKHEQKKGHLGYYIEELELAILGKYETDCGGCDGIKTADEVCRRVRLFATDYENVLLEGILVAHTFKRYHELAEELQDCDYRFLFLNTPKNKCIKRVLRRRKRKGNTKEFNTTNLEHDFKQITTNVYNKMCQAGHNVHILQHKTSVSDVLEHLGYYT